jgi:hypothetical protein
MAYAPLGAESGLTKRQLLERLAADLYLERTSFDAAWRELDTYFFTTRSRFFVTDRNRGDRRNQHLINGTPRFAARTLQSGMHAGLTSPSRPWFTLSAPDPELNKYEPVKRWLHDVSGRLRDVFVRSNIYKSLPHLYGDLGVFGTAAMGILEDEEDVLRTWGYPIGSFAVGLDERGVANTFVRDYVLTVRQLLDQFGRTAAGSREIDWSRFSLNVKSLWDNGRAEAPITITWIVAPNEEYRPGNPFARYMKFRSCWFEKGREQDGDTYIRESGFRQFPVVVPRWDVTGEDTYATGCPGMDALGDDKGMQFLERRKAQAIDKALAPPLVGPSTLRTQKVSVLPSDITYDDAAARSATQGGLRPIFEVRMEGVQAVAVEIDRHEYRVNRAFFVDLFLMLSQPDPARGAQPITAEEVRERHEEKLLALGPVLERLNDELLDPTIDRSFALLLEKGLVPPPPEELRGAELRVEYTSILAQAQKLLGVVGQDRFLQSVGTLAQWFPEARHKVRVFQAVDDYRDMLGVNPNLVRSDEEAQELAAQEAQAAAAERQAAQIQQLAAGAAALGKTPLNGGTALEAVLGRGAA